MTKLITKKELVQLGFSEYASASLIFKAKENLVKEGFDYYKNPRIGRVPTETIEKILGTKLT